MDRHCTNLNKKRKLSDTHYSNKSPFSILVIKCPEDIPNGRLSPDCAPYFGNKCTFTCNPGYTWQTAEVLCQGTWNVSSLCKICLGIVGARLKKSRPAVNSFQFNT